MNAAVVFSTGFMAIMWGQIQLLRLNYDSNVGTSSVPEVEFWVSMRGKSETVAAAACSFCV